MLYSPNAPCTTISDEEEKFDSSIIKPAENIPTEVYKDLEIRENEIKVIIEFALYDTKPSDKNMKDKLGFSLMPLQSSAQQAYFNSIGIFMPYSELFSEIPQSEPPATPPEEEQGEQAR
jgi:hypothetical protein